MDGLLGRALGVEIFQLFRRIGIRRLLGDLQLGLGVDCHGGVAWLDVILCALGCLCPLCFLRYGVDGGTGPGFVNFCRVCLIDLRPESAAGELFCLFDRLALVPDLG